MRVVVKIGTSSLTTDAGTVNPGAVAKLADEVAGLRGADNDVVIVTSAAISVGLPRLGYRADNRPTDPDLLRAASAVGQISLIDTYAHALGAHDLVVGQVLLAPTDFWFRKRYLKSRGTLNALLEAGAVPVINENDAVADDEIRFGDNDRLAALVAHLVDADRLVLLTDTPGLFTADPRLDTSASLIEEIVEFDQRLEAMAGGPGSSGARGGMASKLAAAKIATWSGVETVIALASRPGVVGDAVAGTQGVGTVFRARSGRLGARKLWIAFAVRSVGRITVDDGARRALVDDQRSLLAPGVRAVSGEFTVDDPVEVADESGRVFAKGLVGWSGTDLARFLRDRGDRQAAPVIHRDDLVMLPR